MYEKGDAVWIKPINETGRVWGIRPDMKGELLIDVIRDSDGEMHVCREFEVCTLAEHYER